jgi:hypothetical protein
MFNPDKEEKHEKTRENMIQKLHEIYMSWIHFRTFQKIHGWILRSIYLSLYLYYNALVFLIRWNKVFCIGWVIHASVNSTPKTMSDLRGVAHICMHVCMYVCNGFSSFLKIMTWLEYFFMLVACTMIQFRSMWRSCRRTTTVSVCVCAHVHTLVYTSLGFPSLGFIVGFQVSVSKSRV